MYSYNLRGYLYDTLLKLKTEIFLCVLAIHLHLKTQTCENVFENDTVYHRHVNYKKYAICENSDMRITGKKHLSPTTGPAFHRSVKMGRGIVLTMLLSVSEDPKE